MKDVINMKNNIQYNIMTPNGFQPFHGMREIYKDKYYQIKFCNDKEIKCSINHPFIYNGKKILASKLKIGDKVDGKNSRIYRISSIKLINKPIKLYDIINVSDGNIFACNDIISHNCDFATSGNTLIESDILKFYEETFIKDPIEMRGYDKAYWIWEYCDYSRQYMVVADVARGDGSDFSTFHIIDIEKLVQVAEYEAQLGTKDFGNMLVNVATEYNNALLVIENANIGWAVIQQVQERNYQNLYYSYKDADRVDVEKYINKGYDLKNHHDMVPGFTTSPKSRPLIISKLELLCRERLCVIQSKRLLDQLRVFIWLNNKAQAQRGYNDDLVLAWSIGLWVRDTALRLMSQGVELQKQAMNYIGSSNYYNGGYSKVDIPENPYIIKTGNSSENIDWLL